MKNYLLYFVYCLQSASVRDAERGEDETIRIITGSLEHFIEP